MNNTLPEGQSQKQKSAVKKASKMPAEQQVAELLQKLAGNKAFKACRGNFHGFPYEEMLNIGNPPNPSVAIKKFEKWVGSQKVMLTMLARLKRDKRLVAFEELEKALCDSDYILTGESVPVEETEPGVLIIFDPEKTFLLARWMNTSQDEDLKRWLENGKIPEERSPCGSLMPQFVETFPDWVKEFKESSRNHKDSPTKVFYPRIHDVWNRFREKFSRNDILFMFVDPHRTGYWEGGCSVGIFVKRKEQGEVLSLFSRDEQETIATWRFDYPAVNSKDIKVAWGDSPNLWIGIHPEMEHETWKRLWPSFASRGCAFGHGAVIVDKDKLGESHSLKKGTVSTQKYKVPGSPYPHECQGYDFATMRTLIGFPYSRDLDDCT